MATSDKQLRWADATRQRKMALGQSSRRTRYTRDRAGLEQDSEAVRPWGADLDALTERKDRIERRSATLGRGLGRLVQLHPPHHSHRVHCAVRPLGGRRALKAVIRPPNGKLLNTFLKSIWGKRGCHSKVQKASSTVIAVPSCARADGTSRATIHSYSFV